ncbi:MULTISPECIES: chromate transporter [Anaerococcus]|jgi:chromate transport protein|uniref:Chromate transporter n=1 Tax=Anaerococcus nagyae TaxID=1755241 RepID=A0A3E2TL58_9FIRM|nr:MULTISPECIES: chromate transporter [Anaerococcus]MBP2069151.1 chromate transporter [Anaerococcus nagyae]MDU1828233.1 chromate transporter [Anaerococcus sp.]MDU1864407.1 chromate transporter [Anaerococcus sp.]MDU2354405.1 chromate transporter [Anaerococcus sp.]MDU2565186.1 chromate transporter [Anaerococcus sp.]
MLIKLFLSFLKIGLFSFGGGYAALPLIQEQVVDINQWLSLNEFNDLITISQMTPGPIAINSATFVGTRIAGFPGAMAATFGCVLPSALIVGTISYFYKKYSDLDAISNVLYFLRPAIVSMILMAGISILRTAFFNTNTIAFNNLDWLMFIIFGLSLFAMFKLKTDPIKIMLASGIIYLLISIVFM